MPLKSFIVRTENTGEEGHQIDAYDHEQAAEMFAEWEDMQGDYGIVGGSPEDMEVESQDGVIKRFRVYGETVAHYRASEIK